MDQMAFIKINSSKPGLERIHIIALTFLLSFLIHIFLFIAIQSILPNILFESNLKVYQVDLMTPMAEELKESGKSSDYNDEKIEKNIETKAKEATISLDTGIEIYAPYARVIKEKIFYHWVYPLSARNEDMQGDLLVAFRIDSLGNLITCEIKKTSGYKILDNYALEAIKLANPFPPFPDSLDLQFLNINASFSYQLSLE